MISLQIAFPENVEPDGSALYFGIATKYGIGKIVSGVRSVEQHFAKLLLTDQGSDPFNPTLGTTLKDALKEKVTLNTKLGIKNEIVLAVNHVFQTILDSQRKLTLSTADTLVSIQIQRLEYTEDTGWELRVRLNTADGNTAQVLLGG